MKRLIPLLMVMVAVSTAAKTTYIPKYRSYIQIVNGNDTISMTDSISEIELADKNSMFSIRVEHEEVDKEKVKEIKRAKRAAGWMSFSAAMSSVSSSLSSNNLQYYVRSQNARIANELSNIYYQDAANQQKLSTDVWIDNNSNEEIIINDTERGLLWYIKPNQSLHIHPNNPDASILRISDIHNKTVQYAVVATGYSLLKWEVEWEDEDSWVVSIYRDTFNEYRSDSLEKYRRVWKNTFVEQDMTIEEFKAFKAEEKKKRKNEK